MEGIFLKILNMSITAGWLVLAVLLLRLLLRRAPKAMIVVLWALVGLRLVLPFSFESKASLVPSSETVPPSILYEQSPAIHSGIPMVNNTVNPVLSQSMSPNLGDSVNPMQVAVAIAAQVWLLGMAGMLVYLLVSYLRLRWQVREAARLQGRIWIGDRISSPFILGILRPRIYLPSDLEGRDRDFVIAHEQAHLKRRDHWWKPLGFLLLSVHWFNPLLWVGYILLCRDIELACDEKVIRSLGSEAKKPYSETLLRCSAKRAAVSACPLAFGEVGVKQRIKGILHYKKPTLWILIAAMLLTGAFAVAFLTDPATEPEVPTLQEDVPTQETADVTTPSASEKEPVTPTPIPLAGLKLKFPQYFGLDTAKGLEVYVWQMGKELYSWALLPGRDQAYTLTELMDLHKHPATTEEMRAIVASYGLPRDMVTIIPFSMPYSSYYYEINVQYLREVEALFWQDASISLGDTSCEIIDSSNGGLSMYYDIDDDGVKEAVSLGPGPTSGLFTFTITVTQDGEVEYFNMFSSESYDLRFVLDLDNNLLLEGTTHGEEPEVHFFEVSLANGNIRISRSANFSYWGEQGPDSPWAPRDGSIDRSAAEYLSEYYLPDKPDGLLHIQSYRIFSSESTSGTPTTDGDGNVTISTLYMMVMHCSYNISTQTPEAITAEITPAVMVVQHVNNESDILLDYQVPTEEKGLTELFPTHLIGSAKQTHIYQEELRAECDKLAAKQAEKYHAGNTSENSAPTEVTSPTESTTEQTANDDKTPSPKLIVMGKNISDVSRIVIGGDGEQTKLPFVAIMKALGAKFSWDTSTTATVAFRGTEYLFDANRCSLTQKGDSFNFLIPPPGGKQYYQPMDYELILDSGTMYSLFALEGLGLRIIISPNEMLVEIK